MSNRVGKRAVWLLGAALLAGILEAEEGEAVYRCQTENDVVYQDFPCEGEGEQVELPTDLPDPEEVKRLRQRQAEMRMQLEALERQRLREKALEAQRAPEVVIIQSVDGGGANGKDEEDRASVACPLGLANCKKPGDRVFRRPAENSEGTPSPLGLSDDNDRVTDEPGGTLAEPRE